VSSFIKAAIMTGALKSAVAHLSPGGLNSATTGPAHGRPRLSRRPLDAQIVDAGARRRMTTAALASQRNRASRIVA
jgi:hypothetical protein